MPTTSASAATTRSITARVSPVWSAGSRPSEKTTSWSRRASSSADTPSCAAAPATATSSSSAVLDGSDGLPEIARRSIPATLAVARPGTLEPCS
ncbi:hypothetical protein WHI96_13900 [Pseudonocardia tropica]|uniref:Uncharacterized protein n=1 Tax=Pseudonocardia tropica TaxID=681289 RepID=A0ABV1JVD8_9PSEU